MPATKKILVSLHGRRIGLSAQGELIVDGRAVLMANDAGLTVESMPTVIAKTVAVTLTADELFNRTLTGTHAAGATQAYTLPTGAAMQAYINANPDLMKAFALPNASFRWGLVNLSTGAANTITLTAAAGHTIVGSPLVPSNDPTTGGLNGTSTSLWRTVRTADSVFVTYRA
jgi:hypothetical protein